MARETRDSFGIAVGDLMATGRVRAAVVTLLISSATALAGVAGKMAMWAFSEPWKSDPTLAQASGDAKSALAKSTTADTQLQRAELALWTQVVSLAYEAHCEDRTEQGRAACVYTGIKQFESDLEEAATTPMKSRYEIAATKTLRLIQPGLKR